MPRSWGLSPRRLWAPRRDGRVGRGCMKGACSRLAGHRAAEDNLVCWLVLPSEFEPPEPGPSCALDAPPPWAPLAAPAPAPVGFPPHRAPQLPGLSHHGATPPPYPTPRANITEHSPQPPLRWGSRWWFACCVDLVTQSVSLPVRQSAIQGERTAHSYPTPSAPDTWP